MRNRSFVTLALLVLVLGCAGSTASERMKDGRKVYTAVCAKCHDEGIHGAPVIGRKQDWAGRSNLWEAVLFQHAQSGYLGMPAKGGEQELSEYEVSVAAEYMLNVLHPELPQD
jgi:cytochrome c5